jgi:hypothetical protein
MGDYGCSVLALVRPVLLVLQLLYISLLIDTLISFVVIKVIMGVNLVSYATRRRAGMEAREAEDAMNDFGRDPIGEGKEEQIYNRELKTLLDSRRDDASPTSEIGERTRTGSGLSTMSMGRGGAEKKRVKLEDLTRFTMVKRIW